MLNASRPNLIRPKTEDIEKRLGVKNGRRPRRSNIEDRCFLVFRKKLDVCPKERNRMVSWLSSGRKIPCVLRLKERCGFVVQDKGDGTPLEDRRDGTSFKPQGDEEGGI